MPWMTNCWGARRKLVFAMKKTIRKIFSVLVAVCLCTSMVPIPAMADESDVAAQSDQTLPDKPTADQEQSFSGSGTDFKKDEYQSVASTKVYGIVADENFRFSTQSSDQNFVNPQAAIDGTASGATPGPLFAVFAGNEGEYTYTWTIEDVTIAADGTYQYGPHATTPQFTGVDGAQHPFGTEVTEKLGNAETGYKFQHSITAADDLQQDCIYRYTLSIKSPTDATEVIKAEIFVSVFSNYEKMKIFLGQDPQNATSVEGYLYKDANLVDPVAPILQGQDIAETSPIYTAMADAAANNDPVQSITQPTQLVITNLENKPTSEPAYKLDLNVHLGIPDGLPNALQQGDKVPVYHYDPSTGTVEVLEGVVVQQTDINGNPITIGDQPLLSIEVHLRGTSASLGAFAVGYDNPDGSFTVESSATAGGSISPEGTQTFAVGASPKFVMNAQAGYKLASVSLECDGQPVSMQAGTLAGNVFTLDAARYHMEDGEAWTVNAIFEEPTLSADAFAVRASLRGDGDGTMSIISGAGGTPIKVAMGADVPAPGEDAIMMPAKDGVYLEFNIGSKSRVKSLKINSQEYSVAGTSYFISVLTENVYIEVEYEAGLPEPTITRTITTTVQGGGGSVMDSDGNPQPSATLTVNYGGTGIVTLVPDPGKMVDTAFLKPAGSTEEGVDIAKQITQSDGKANLQVRNVLEDMELTVTFKESDGALTLSVESGTGSVNPSGTVQLAANEVQHVVVTPGTDEDGKAYTVGTIKVGGVAINVDDYLTSRNGGAYYTFNIVLNATAPSAAFERNPDGTTDKVLYLNGKQNVVTVTFDPVTEPAPAYASIITSVAAPGGGSITPTQRVPVGTVAEVWVFPDEGKRVKDVTLNGNSVKNLMTKDGALLTLTEAQTQTDCEVIVSFEDGESPLWPSKKPRYTLHPSAGTGGSVTPASDVMVYEGEAQTFSFIPATGYEPSEIMVDGLPVDKENPGADEEVTQYSYTMKNVRADHNLVFTFEKSQLSGDDRDTYVLEVSAGEHGSVSPSGPMEVARGANVALTVLPDPNYCVDKISVRSKSDTSGNESPNFISGLVNGVYTQYDVQDDLIIEITFKQGTDPNQPSTDINNLVRLGTKNVSVDPGLVLTPEVPGLTFYKEQGTDHASVNQEFTIQVAAGYELSTVTVNGKNLAATEVGEGVYKITVPKEEITSNMLLEVTSKVLPPSTQVVDLRTITVTKEGNGTVSPYGVINGIVRVETGESQTFYFIPDADNKIESVQVDGANVSWDKDTYSYTIPSVTQDMRIHVVFSSEPGAVRPNTATVTVNIDPDPEDGQSHGFASVSTAEVVTPGQLTVSFKPDSGYEMSVWEVVGNQRIPQTLRGGTLYLTDITSNRTFTVAFTKLTQAASYQTVTASSGSNGHVSPEGTLTVVTGSDMTFTFLGDAGYTVDKVWVTRNGNSEEVSAQVDPNSLSYTVKDIQEKVDVWASFKVGQPDGSQLNPCVITATAGTGGIVSPEKLEAVPGTQATFTFMPLRGYQLKSVYDGTREVTKQVKEANGVYAFPVVTSTAIVAEFESSADTNPEANRHDVTLEVAKGADGQAHGQVSPAGIVSVPHGGSVPFTMIPDEGYRVDSITIQRNGLGNEVLTDFDGFKYTYFSVEADSTITVSFRELAPGETVTVPTFYEVMATASVNGAISPSGSITVAEGGMAMFSFQPNDGYRLSYLVVDGANVPATELVRGQYSFIGVKENHTIHAVFCSADEPAADFITVNAGNPSGGSISPSGAQLVMKGSSPQYVISAFYGYTLSDIQVNGQSIFADGPDGAKKIEPVNNAQVSWSNSTLTLKNVQADTGIVALFRKASTSEEDPPVLYSRVTVNNGGGGTVSYSNGTTVIEALKDGQFLDVSIIPDDGNAIGSLSVKTANGDDVDLTDANSASVQQQLKDIWRTGYIRLSADQVNYDVTINVTFRKQTDDEKKEIENGGFTPAKFRTINAQAFGRGTINPHGAVKVAQNASTLFSMVPMQGYELSALHIDGNDAMGMLKDGRTYLFSPGTKDQTIEATFSLLSSGDEGVTYLVRTAIEGADGASGSASVDQLEVMAGGSASLYFWPDEKSKLTALSVVTRDNDGNVVEDLHFGYNQPEYLLANITGDTTVTAHFELLGPDETPPWTIKEAYAKGSVMDNAGGRISPTQATVPQGCQQVFNFFPDAGYEVSFLRVDDAIIYVDANIRSYPLIVDSTDPDNPTTLAVAFKNVDAAAPDVTVTAKVEATVEFGTTGGTAEVWPGERTIPYASSATFYVRPEWGYTIKDVTVDGRQVAFEGVGETSDDNFHPQGIDWSQGKVVGLSSAGGSADAGIAAQANDPYGRDAYYEVYRITVPNVTKDIVANVSLAKISDLSPSGPYWYVPCNAHDLTITTDGGGTVTPMGKGFLPEGDTETIRLNAFTGYYLESVICTYEDGSTVDMTHQVVGSSLQVTMGKQSMSIHAKFTLVSEVSFVKFQLGTAKNPQGNDLVALGKVTTEPPLDSTEFVRDVDGTGMGATITFIPGEKGPNGRDLVLDKVYLNGQRIPLTLSPSNTIRIPTTSGGVIDVEFRELEEGEVIITPEFFTLTGEITSGEGEITAGPLKVMAGGSEAIGFKPAEGWMLDTENCYDWYAEDGSEEMTAHKIAAEDLAKGYYMVKGVDRNHKITVAFVKYVDLEIGWTNGDNGYVTPNTMNGEPIRIEVGASVPFIVAPYEGYDVASVMETMGSAESNVTDKLRTSEATTQELLAMPGHEGFTVKHPEAGVGVGQLISEDAQAQSAQPVAQAENAENGVLYAEAPAEPTSAAPALRNFNYAYGSQTAPITNDTTVMATWTDESNVVKPDPDADLRTITVEIIGEGGTVDPMVGKGYDGESITFNLFPDPGWAVKFIEVSIGGQVEEYTNEKFGPEEAGNKQEYTYGPIDGDGYIKVGFQSVSDPDANDALNRYLRTLQALAQTGDLTAPVMGTLLGIALLAMVMAVITYRRRKKHLSKHAAR